MMMFLMIEMYECNAQQDQDTFFDCTWDWDGDARFLSRDLDSLGAALWIEGHHRSGQDCGQPGMAC